MPNDEFEEKYLVADARNTNEMRALAQRITTWEPRLFLSYTHTDRLYAPDQTLYVMLMTDDATLRRNKHESTINAGDMAVIAPDVSVAVDKPSEFLFFGYDGPPPSHFDKNFIEQVGYETFIYRESGPAESRCGIKRSEILPAQAIADGYRVSMHFVEMEDAQTHLHDNMVEFYYVLYGEGYIGLGADANNLKQIPVKQGSVVAVGTNLYHPPSDGLGMCIFFLYRQAEFEKKF